MIYIYRKRTFSKRYMSSTVLMYVTRLKKEVILEFSPRAGKIQYIWNTASNESLLYLTDYNGICCRSKWEF